MADFDLSTATPVAPAAPSGFDLTTAKPVDPGSKESLRQPDGSYHMDIAGTANDPGMPDITPGLKMLGNLGAGAIRGAGSIGATIMQPYDMLMDKLHGVGMPTLSSLIAPQAPALSSNQQRRADMTAALGTLGADTNSGAFEVGKLGGEVAGTAGAGGAIANLAGRVPAIAAAVPNLLAAVGSSGMTAGSGGNLLANLGTRALGGSIAGGASAGLIDPSSTGTGAVVGGAIPVVSKVAGAAGSALGNLVRGGGVSPEVEALASRAKDLGIDIPADRLVNSKPLNAAAASLNYVPFSGRAATETAMQDQLNIAVSRTFGQDSPNVTQALRKAQTDLGAKFDSTLQNNTVKVDPQFLTDLADAANKANRELGADGASIIGKQVDDIVSKASTGQIDGQAAYNIKRTLDRIGARNSPEAYYALDLKKSLMGALDRSLGPQEAQAFAQTRQQYGNMLDMQKLAQNGAEGDISIARLANMKNINNPDLQELADISAQFLKPRESAHGAAQRVGAASALGVAGNAIGGPLGAGATLAGGAALGRGTNMLLNSNALRNFVLKSGQSAAPGPLNQLMYRAAPSLGADQ